MAYQSSSNGLVAFKAQSAKGSTASGGSGFVLRTAGGAGGRISKNTYGSNEVRRDLMRTRGRHGLRKTSGTYSCEVSLDNCDAFYEAFFRGTWEAALVATEATASLTSIITDSTGTITAGGGSWITAGFRVGDVVRLTNHSTAGNNSRNIRITALTATVMTIAVLDGGVWTTNATPDTAFTMTRPGQKLINPAAGSAVKVYFTIEEYDGDLDLTEIFSDCIINSLKFSMGSSGLLMCEIGWTGTGLFATASGASAPTFTSPTEGTALPLSVVDSILRYSSTDFVDLTGFEISLDVGSLAPEVAGAIISPDVFTGAMSVGMNFSMLRSDYGKMTDYLAETALKFHIVACENESEPKDFLSLFIPDFTLGGIDKSPLAIAAGPRTQTITVPPELIGKDTAGGAYDATMVKLQVSNT
jgi:hypothetical protein